MSEDWNEPPLPKCKHVMTAETCIECKFEVKDNRIAVLEKQLAEINSFLDPAPSPGGDVVWLVKNCVTNLQEALARRDAEIERLKNVVTDCQRDINERMKSYDKLEEEKERLRCTVVPNLERHLTTVKGLCKKYYDLLPKGMMTDTQCFELAKEYWDVMEEKKS